MNNKHAASIRIAGNTNVSEAFPVAGEFPTDEVRDRMIQMSCVPISFSHHTKNTAGWLNSQQKD